MDSKEVKSALELRGMYVRKSVFERFSPQIEDNNLQMRSAFPFCVMNDAKHVSYRT